MDKKELKEIILKVRADSLLDEKDFNRDEFPHLYNLSSAFFYSQIPVPREYKKPEFVFIKDYSSFKRHSEITVTIAEWNMIWESGHLRADFFWQKLPTKLNWLKKFEGVNLYLVPDNKSLPFYTYAPLYHLLPFKTRKNFNLPLIKKGNWPFLQDHDSHIIGELFSSNFSRQLSNAFAHHIWPLLDTQNKITAFSKHDPLQLLSHNLNFWLPDIYSVIEDRLHEFGRVKPETDDQLKKIEELRKEYPDIDVKLPLMGGTIWEGEDDAWSATQELVDKSDKDGNLRNIIDAIKSNRIQDDFSDKWSYAKEDFERKLYSKRNKTKVNFVEIEDNYPIHCGSSEIEDNILWDDLFSLLDAKEKRIVICLRKGITKHKEISEILGYKNHSSVTKKLNLIRQKALKLLND